MIPTNAVFDKLVNTDTFILVRSDELLDFINRINSFQHISILEAIAKKESDISISKNNDLFKLYSLLLDDVVTDKYIKLEKTASGKINIDINDTIPEKFIIFRDIINPVETPTYNFYRKLYNAMINNNVYALINNKLKR